MKIKDLTSSSVSQHPKNAEAWIRRYKSFFGVPYEDSANFNISWLRNQTLTVLNSEDQILKVLCFLFNGYPKQLKVDAYIQMWRIAGPVGVLDQALSEESFLLAWNDESPKDWFFFPKDSVVIDLSYSLAYPYLTGIQRVVKEVARFAFQQKGNFYFVTKSSRHGFYPKLVNSTDITNFLSVSRNISSSGDPKYLSLIFHLIFRSLVFSLWAGFKAFCHALYHEMRLVLGFLKKRKVPGGELALKLIDQYKVYFRQLLTKTEEEGPKNDTGELNLAFWGTSVLLPEIVLEEQYVDFYKMLRRNGAIRLSMIVYDLGPFSFPEYSAVGQNFTHYLTLLRVADSVSCISESVASDLTSFMGLVVREVPEKITISADLLAGDFTKFQNQSLGTPARLTALDGTKFALVVGTFEPRKNHQNILRAFKVYLGNHKDSDLQMVFAGNPGWKNDNFLLELNREIKSDSRIIKYASLTDAELSWLYEHCRFLVFCSHLEGFGLPILEALFWKKPVITSARGSMGELAKKFGGCLLVNPLNPVEIANQIEKLNHDDLLREQLLTTIDLSKAPSWDQYAQTILNRSLMGVSGKMPTSAT